MPESEAHRYLIRKGIKSCIHDIVNGGQFICFDSSSNDFKKNNPPSISGNTNSSIPDFFIHCFSKNLIIIGEAKTIQDLDTDHSIMQYISYVEWGSNSGLETYLVFSVPFGCSPRIRSIIRNYLKPISSEKMKFLIFEF